MFTVYLNGQKYAVEFRHYKTEKDILLNKNGPKTIRKFVDETECKITELGRDENNKFTIPVKEYVAIVDRYNGILKYDPFDRSKARKYSLTKALKEFTKDDKVRTLFWTNYFLNHSFSEGKDFFNYFTYSMPQEIFKFVSDNLAGDAKNTLTMILP